SYPSLRTDLVNDGAEWVEEELVTSDGVNTSRNPDDHPAFCDALLGAIRAVG
ncbi:MAG: DJ-1/PfpI family protein, partial [Dietzia sp.]|nr:DJ-1/PfpI family protein [Dietzia sp.]